MDASDFRVHGKIMIDWIADYLEGINNRPVIADVKPGFMTALIPEEAPQNPEKFDKIFQDLEPIIMKGVTHWQHPQFYGYYPTANSYPALLGDMVSDAISCIGFSWTACPSCTELEVHMMDWLAKAMALPEQYLSAIAHPGAKGGGVIQGTASEATLVALLAARSRILGINANNMINLEDEEGVANVYSKLSKLVVYCSDQAHSSVERAAMLGIVHIKKLASNEKDCLRGETLREAIENDKEKGRIPFMCIGTIGTTSTCAFDNIEELGEVCKTYGLWFHVDAAYAGTALLCPEFRDIAQGIHLTDSFNFNPHKWMCVTFDCSALWLKESKYLEDAFNVDPLYLKQGVDGMPDFRHWQIPLGRRFRSLKLWFVLRAYGIEGLQNHVRNHVRLAKLFAKRISSNTLFEIIGEVKLGLVCFRMKEGNDKTKKLLDKIKEDKRIYLVPSESKSGSIFLRLSINASSIKEDDIEFTYKVIDELSRDL